MDDDDDAVCIMLDERIGLRNAYCETVEVMFTMDGWKVKSMGDGRLPRGENLRDSLLVLLKIWRRCLYGSGSPCHQDVQTGCVHQMRKSDETTEQEHLFSSSVPTSRDFQFVGLHDLISLRDRARL